MSSITINKNIHKGFEILGHIPNKWHEPFHNDVYRSILFGDMLKMQYFLVRNYLTKRYIDWMHVDKDFKGNKFLNHYYRNFYSVNFQSLNDELYEVDNALSKKYDEEKRYFLTIEEIIDVAHFIFQYFDYIEEHQFVLNHPDKDNINSSYLKNILVNNNDIINKINNQIDKKSIHIINEIKSLPEIENNNWICLAEIWKLLQNMHFENRTFMRYINWKPWKNYQLDHYNTSVFTGMVYSVRNLFSELVKMLHIALRLNEDNYNQYVNWLYESFPEFEKYQYDNSKNELELSITYSILYAAYIAKNLENQRRQIEDPRYKNKLVEYYKFNPLGLLDE